MHFASKQSPPVRLSREWARPGASSSRVRPSTALSTGLERGSRRGAPLLASIRCSICSSS